MLATNQPQPWGPPRPYSRVFPASAARTTAAVTSPKTRMLRSDRAISAPTWVSGAARGTTLRRAIARRNSTWNASHNRPAATPYQAASLRADRPPTRAALNKRSDTTWLPARGSYSASGPAPKRPDVRDGAGRAPSRVRKHAAAGPSARVYREPAPGTSEKPPPPPVAGWVHPRAGPAPAAAAMPPVLPRITGGGSHAPHDPGRADHGRHLAVCPLHDRTGTEPLPQPLPRLPAPAGPGGDVRRGRGGGRGRPLRRRRRLLPADRRRAPGVLRRRPAGLPARRRKGPRPGAVGGP